MAPSVPDQDHDRLIKFAGCCQPISEAFVPGHVGRATKTTPRIFQHRTTGSACYGQHHTQIKQACSHLHTFSMPTKGTTQILSANIIKGNTAQEAWAGRSPFTPRLKTCSICSLLTQKNCYTFVHTWLVNWVTVPTSTTAKHQCIDALTTVQYWLYVSCTRTLDNKYDMTLILLRSIAITVRKTRFVHGCLDSCKGPMVGSLETFKNDARNRGSPQSQPF